MNTLLPAVLRSPLRLPSSLRIGLLSVSLLLPLTVTTASAQLAPIPQEPSAPEPLTTRPLPTLPLPLQSSASSDLEMPVLLPTTFRINNPARPVALRLNAELGTIGILKHTIQFSQDGSELDYVREGGQNNLYFFARISAELEIFRRHSFILLYQPLDVKTEEVLRRDISIDKQLFPSGTPVNFRYGFDFYRFSYQFDFFKSPRYELAIGLGLQLRNASISFTSGDGTLRRVNNNIGPVPLLRMRGRYTFDNGLFLGMEVDGLYARGKVITGSLYSFEGALLDASIRMGVAATSFMDVYLNLRYLGGGAQGTSDNNPPPSDGYTNNWLHTLVTSIGFTVR